MLYWLPATGASSARLYWESFVAPGVRARSGVPTGCSIFPKEIMRMSRRWAATRFTDIVYWNELDRGGHFAAFEQPATFVDELRVVLPTGPLTSDGSAGAQAAEPRTRRPERAPVSASSRRVTSPATRVAR